MVGIVESATGSWYEVREEVSGKVVRARLRGRMRLGGSRATNPVVVGDRVELSVAEGSAWVEKVLPRENYIIRRASNLSRESHIIAANVDQALVVATMAEPVTSREFIDRFLVTCEAYGVPATVGLNKVDITAEEEVGEFERVYEGAGYRVMRLSGTTGEGVEELREYLEGKVTLVAGNSGVGKSTLIGAVAPGVDVKVGRVSASTGKGMHTTTFSRMYGLGNGTWVIDTPGIKGFGLIDIEPEEVGRYFPDFAGAAKKCNYYNCTHVHEPGCGVAAAVEAGEIDEGRYESYLKMIEEDGKYR